VKVSLTPRFVEILQEVRLVPINSILIRPGSLDPLCTGGHQVYFPLLQRGHEGKDAIHVVRILRAKAAKIRRNVSA
jgi:hypothetical protein